jgi:ribosomal protein S18 acetylase RimI-like enzyme
MQRGFEQPIPTMDLPEGFRLLRWSPGFDETARMVINAAFSDHWASGPMSPDDWKQAISLEGTFKPQYTWLATYGEEVAGVCINRVLDIDNANKGLHAGWIGTLGVKRAYRGRGLGKALLVASMQAFAEDGYTAAGLSVDTENPTGALRLYESLGFTPVSREIHFVREI